MDNKRTDLLRRRQDQQEMDGVLFRSFINEVAGGSSYDNRDMRTNKNRLIDEQNKMIDKQNLRK